MNRSGGLDRLCHRLKPHRYIRIPSMKLQRHLWFFGVVATSTASKVHGFIVGSRALIDSWSVQSARSWIHSTSYNLQNRQTRYGNINVARRASDSSPVFKYATPIQVEVMSFGPLGASVNVLARGHDSKVFTSKSVSPLGSGLILQKEIEYFRQARRNVDVKVGEILPAFVEEVRDDGLLNISLRQPGGKAKAEATSKLVLDKLTLSPDGTLGVGDKSTPQEIRYHFPGVSKGVFKKAVAALYVQGKVKPGPHMISLMNQDDQKERK